MNENIFELKNIEYTYPGKVPALAGIRLDIKKGERIALIGANGSGKSTLLTMLNGLIYPSSGTIVSFDRELSEAAFNDMDFVKFFRAKTGFVFQNPEVQLFCPTVREDIAFGPLCMGMPAEEVRKQTEETAAELGITELLDRPPHRLSIGEKKKVALATVLVINPDVMLLDEPTAGLDPLTTQHIVDILAKASTEGKTIITATHDLHIVEEISDRVIILSRHGNIAAEGKPDVLLNNFKLLEENNLVHAHGHKHADGTTMHVHPHQHLHHKHEHKE